MTHFEVEDQVNPKENSLEKYRREAKFCDILYL